MLDEGFEYLLTADKNIQNQQNLDILPVKLIVVLTFDNRFKTLVRHVQKIQQSILEADDSLRIVEIDIRY